MYMGSVYSRGPVVCNGLFLIVRSYVIVTVRWRARGVQRVNGVRARNAQVNIGLGRQCVRKSMSFV